MTLSTQGTDLSLTSHEEAGAPDGGSPTQGLPGVLGEDCVRVTVRAIAGHFHKELDVSLPVAASLDEVLPEITALMNAPTLTRPWRVVTAAGRPLDHSVPLARTRLNDGAVVLLRPLSATPAPVLRDAAEALAHSVATKPPRGIAAAGTWLGLACLAGVLGAAFGWAWGFAAAASAGFGIHLWARQTRSLALAIVVSSAAAAGLAIGEPRLSAMAAALGAAGALGLLHLARLGSPTLTGATGAASLLAFLGGAGAQLPGLGNQAAAGGAAVLIAALALCAIAPTACTRLAGLRVPQLPTAGEDLADVEATQPDSERRARRARALYEGVLLGTCAAVLPAVALLTTSGYGAGARGWAQLACLLFAAAVLLHCARHSADRASWALALMGLGACAGVCGIAGRAGAHGDFYWPIFLAAGLVILALATACLWAPLVGRVEPTTRVWVERAEALALALLLPLGCHLLGLFDLIRGLG